MNKMSNTSIPKILNDVVIAVSNARMVLSENVEGEGRGGSLVDEGLIKKLLVSKFGEKRIMSVPPRGFGDILVLDYDDKTLHVVNIKTSLGSSDNGTSKLGFLYALTDIDYYDLPKSINWKKFHSLLKTRGKDIKNKDYWYLCIDKNDTGKVIIRGSKQIVNWVQNANTANLLQINWTKERECEPANRTFEEAKSVIVGGIINCFKKSFNNLPTEWQDIIKT
jgi:hypothetical protein